jgi:hypothetical protein
VAEKQAFIDVLLASGAIDAKRWPPSAPKPLPIR